MMRKIGSISFVLAFSSLAVSLLFLLNPSQALAVPPYYARGEFNGWGATDQMYDDGTNGDVTSGDGIYTALVTPATAGRYEWKAADAGWTESWPNSNAWLVTSSDAQPVMITLDTNTHGDGWTPNQHIANAADGLTTWTAVGDWQGWDNGNPATAMSSVGGGLYRFATIIPTPGLHQFKPVRTGSWDAVGQDGPGGGRSINSANLDFTTTVDEEFVVFWLNTTTGRIRVQSYGALVINELDADQVGTDAAEFIELYDGGVGNVSLNGLVLVFYNGSNDLSYASFDLDGFSTDANGYFVLCGNAANVPNCDWDVTPNTDLIQNGQDAVALYAGDAANFPTNTPVTTANLVDAIVYDTSDPDDPGLLVLLNPGQPQVDENFGGNGVINSNQRCPNGSGGARNTDTYIQQLPTAGTTNYCPVNLIVDKTGPPLALPGDIITYTLTYTNAGPGVAPNTVLTDTLPTGVTYLADDSGLTCTGCTVGSTQLVWSAGTLASSAADTFQVTAQISTSVSYGLLLTNTLVVTSDGTESNPADNTATSTTLINPFDLSVEKQGPAYGISGANNVYQIALQTTGILTAPNVILTDTLPISTTYVSDDSGVTPTNPTPGVLVWNFGTLPASSLLTFNLTVTVDASVPPAAVLTNQIEATTDNPFDNPVNNTSQTQATFYPLVPIHDVQFVPDPTTNDASPYTGQVVWVEGIVTSEPGEIDVPSRLMVIQDPAGGPWSGVVIFRTGGFPVFAPEGALVRVLGTVIEFNGLTEFNLGSGPFSIEILSTGNPLPGPVILSTADFPEASPAASEQWESVFIEFQDATVTDDNPGFGEWLFDDGAGPARADDLGELDGDMTYLPTDGDQYTYIRGIGYFSFSQYKLIPRRDADIGLFSNIPLLEKAAPAQVNPGDLYTYTITLQNQLGYTLNSVVITDVVPVHSTFAYALDGGTETGGVVTWNAGNLPDQGTVSVRFAVTATSTSGEVVTNDNYAVVASNYTTATFGTPVSTLVLGSLGPACGDPAVRIHGIQGSGSASPLVGAVLVIEGVVVGDYQVGGYSGYFVQEEDAHADANPMTSEGIFVFNTSFPVQAGDVVRVFGTVAEFNGLTEMTQVTNVVVCSSGASVTPASLTLPVASMAEWEWVEGMLLNIPHPLYVTEIFRLGRYGEVSLSVNDRVDQPTQVTDPGASALALQDLNNRSRVQLNDGATPQNPDPIIYPSPELSATNTLRGGDMVTDLTGVVNYAFGAYLVEPVGSIDFIHSNPRTTAPDPISGTLKVVSFNVLNYFSTIDTGPDICGPLQNQDCRGADSALEFTRQRDKIINAILAIDADIYGLIEIENHPDDEAVDDLISGLNAIAGAGTFSKINTGVIGSDAIKVAFIYKTATVTPVGSFAVLDDTFDPNYHDNYNRPALAQTFQEIATGEALTVIVNHLKSKGSDCNALGDPDTGDGQGNCNLTRLGAANILMDWLATDPTGSGDPDFLIIGDLNSYAMEDPIMALATGGFHDVYGAWVAENYSYVFDGQWGTLDYSLANNSLFPQVAGVTAWHINADEPIALDYNVEFKTPHHVTSLYSPEPYRASDHDPVIVSFNLGELEASFTSNSPVTLGELSIFTSTVSQENVSYLWDFGDGSGTSTDANPTYTYAAAGTYPVTLTVTNQFVTVTVTGAHVVNPVEEPPLDASFTSNSPITLGDLAVFTSTVNQSGVTYAWDFGDGGTSTAANPTHLYAAADTYTVVLTVTNGVETVNVTGSVVVNPVPETETELYLPLIFKSETTAHVPQSVARMPFSGILLAFVGLSGVFTLRRKR